MIIDSMQKDPVNKDLEEEMESFFMRMQVQQYENIFEDTFKDIARHFAIWQKEQDKQWLAENHKYIFNNGYAEGFEVGRDDMYDEMIKETIEGKVLANGMGNPILHLWEKGRDLIGKSVKVLIIEEN